MPRSYRRASPSPPFAIHLRSCLCTCARTCCASICNCFVSYTFLLLIACPPLRPLPCGSSLRRIVSEFILRKLKMAGTHSVPSLEQTCFLVSLFFFFFSSVRVSTQESDSMFGVFSAAQNNVSNLQWRYRPRCCPIAFSPLVLKQK